MELVLIGSSTLYQSQTLYAHIYQLNDFIQNTVKPTG